MRQFLVSCILFISLFSLGIFPAFALTPTPCPVNQSQTELGCIPNDPGGFVSSLYGIGLGLIGGVSVLFIIYGGYLILTSQGSPNQLNKGKSYIMYAIAGLVLAILGFVFIQVITVDILHIPGFSK